MIEGYERKESGALRLAHPGTMKVYDKAYVSYYETCPQDAMSRLRLDALVHALGWQPEVLLDFGCGTGHFAATAEKAGTSAFGYDVSGYSIPNNVKPCTDPFSRPWEVVTFFDSMEHLEDPASVINRLQTNRIMISLPWCHADTMGDDWFTNWKHRKPAEHMWHFNPTSLCNFMDEVGFRPIFIGNPEDAVRKPVDQLPNILTGVFSRK